MYNKYKEFIESFTYHLNCNKTVITLRNAVNNVGKPRIVNETLKMHKIQKTEPKQAYQMRTVLSGFREL